MRSLQRKTFMAAAVLAVVVAAVPVFLAVSREAPPVAQPLPQAEQRPPNAALPNTASSNATLPSIAVATDVTHERDAQASKPRPATAGQGEPRAAAVLVKADPFAEADSLQKLSSVLDASMQYLDREQAQAAFQASGADHLQAYQAALSYLRAPYPKAAATAVGADPLPAEHRLDVAIHQRVAALRFFELSAHTLADDCQPTLQSFAQQWDASPTTGLARKNLELDAYELTQACARIDRQAVESLVASLKSQAIKKAMALGLSYDRPQTHEAAGRKV